MLFPPKYFCSDFITYKESVIKKSPPTSNDRFNHKNQSVQKNTYKVTKQVYRVKKDGRLIKNSDLTQRIEKSTVEEISASSIEQISPYVECVSNNIAEQKPSSAEGQDDLKATGSDETGLIGVLIGLTGASSESGISSKAKNWIRPSFKELLAKYEKMGATQKQRRRSSEAKDEKSSSRSYEQLDPRPSQDNCAAMPYSGLVAPWFWPNPCYYTPYNMMHMQPYSI